MSTIMTDDAFADNMADSPRYVGMSLDVICDALLNEGELNFDKAQRVTQTLGIRNRVS